MKTALFSDLIAELPVPPRYFPADKGVYEVAPGLRTLGTAFGNGAIDGHVFQFDGDYARYRENKDACRAERLSKYLCESDFDPATQKAVARFMIDRLVQEEPMLFRREARAEGEALHCALTGETLEFDSELILHGMAAKTYASAFDALASQVQEDVTVMKKDPASGRDWLAAAHLCAPSHWAAEDKIGKNFFNIHTPVAGIEKINAAAPAWVDAMIQKGPYVRFVWGFGTDDRLNHHPSPPPGWEAGQWKGRSFQLREDGRSPFILRVERQVIFGLPHAQASVFAIRVSFIDGEVIRRDPAMRDKMCSALRSMNPAGLAYKGLTESLADTLHWLEG